MAPLTRLYKILIILSSNRNPQLTVLTATDVIGNKRLVSTDLDFVWPAVSYRIRTANHHRLCELILPKVIKKWIKTAFKGPIKTRYYLEKIFNLPVKYLEYYDTLFITTVPDGPVHPTAPPAYVDQEGGEDYLCNMSRDRSIDPDGGDHQIGQLLRNSFYHLSLSSTS